MLKTIYIVLQTVGVSALAYGREICSEMLTGWALSLLIAAGGALIIKSVLDEIAVQKAARMNYNPFEQAKNREQDAKKREEARRLRQIYRALQKFVHSGIASPNTVYHRVRTDGKIEAGVVLAEVVQIPWYLRCWFTVLQKSQEKWRI